MKTAQQILERYKIPNEEYGGYDIAYNDAISAMEEYAQQSSSLTGQKGYEKEFVIWCINNVDESVIDMIDLLPCFEIFDGNEHHVPYYKSLDEVFEYWQREVKGK